MENTGEIFTQTQSHRQANSMDQHKRVQDRECLSNVQRIVVKVGSSTISDNLRINEAALDGLVHDLATVKQNGVEVILGHVGSDCSRLALSRA